MLKSVNVAISSTKLSDRLKQLGQCKYDCSWVNNKHYYDNYIIAEDDTSELITLATNTEYFSTNDNNYWIPIHAWRFIGRLKIKEAINPLINTFNHYPDIDWCSHELPHVFEMLGKDAVEPLANKLLEKSNTEFGQFLILESMASIAQTDKSCRQSIIDILIDLLDCEDKEASYLNTGILLNLLKLCVVPDIRLFEILEEIIENDERASHVLFPEHVEQNIPFSTLPVSTQLDIRKFGRNEPCPCGSGKKYKKCCLD